MEILVFLPKQNVTPIKIGKLGAAIVRALLKIFT